MKLTKEVLLAKIEAAYTATGYKPIFGAYYEKGMDNVERACPLTALVNANINGRSPPIHCHNSVEQEIYKLLSVEHEWVVSFIGGVDGFPAGVPDEKAFALGKYIASHIMLEPGRYV